MMRARVLWHLVKADFLTRVRRTSFLLTLGFAVFVGYETFAGGIVMSLDDYRGVYNSAWVGALMAVVTSCFLSLVAFYIVKGSVQRDVETRVGQILAATPMSKSFYTVAKALGNFAVLAAMVGVMAVAAVLMQLLRGEDRVVHVGALLGPLVLLSLPVMAVVSALVVLFETLPVLRGGLGNVAWFFLWMALLVAGVPEKLMHGGVLDRSAEWRDLMGLGTVLVSARVSLLQVDPGFRNGFTLNIGGQRPSHTFVWNGIEWTGALFATRVGWTLLAALMALLAAVFFHRFDPAREWWRRSRTPKTVEKRAPVEALASAKAIVEEDAWRRGLTPLDRVGARTNFGQLVVAELRLMLQGQRWWWYAGAVGLSIACLASPPAAGRGGVILAAWIWPLLLWSQMGSREARWSTGALLYSAPRTLGRQLPAAWVAGVLVAMATGGGLAIRLALAGDAQGLAGWAAGAVFIPSLALALGVWSGTGKWFEALYTAWWYIGPLHHTPGLDFMGTTAGSSRPMLYLAMAGVLMASCWVRRRAQLGYA
jgi:hypothetical protein